MYNFDLILNSIFLCHILFNLPENQLPAVVPANLPMVNYSGHQAQLSNGISPFEVLTTSQLSKGNRACLKHEMKKKSVDRNDQKHVSLGVLKMNSYWK